jgi:cytosine/creatinine deaminase
MKDDFFFLQEAFNEAKKSMAEGGIPIGAILVCEGEVIGRGYNRRVQLGSAVHHAEINCFENAGRLSPATYAKSTLYTTLSPCFMCAGAAVLFGVKRIVAGENRTVAMGEEFLKAQGVNLNVVDSEECYALLQSYIAENPSIWHEDKGDN